VGIECKAASEVAVCVCVGVGVCRGSVWVWGKCAGVEGWGQVVGGGGGAVCAAAAVCSTIREEQAGGVREGDRRRK